ncbi:MAG: DUF2281 domain-containing protein [Candidatus Cloacimonetes bacterium]|nr:DUF2281 domain-containing protein [Candidatus Cloacimonadota bacterium]
MHHSKQNLDISILPNNAQQEIYDFYQFLKQRYKIKEKKDKKFSYKFLDNPFKVNSIIIPSREELHER